MGKNKITETLLNGLSHLMNSIADEVTKKATFKGATIFNPCGDGNMLDIPGLGEKIYTTHRSIEGGFKVVEMRFVGDERQLLELAEGKMFINRFDAETYKEKCNDIVNSMKQQLPELMQDLMAIRRDERDD